MRLRIPGWCSDPEISVNGNPTATLPPVLDGYITIDRHWLDGDIVQLPLPMRVTAISRDYGAAGLRLGPLVLALGIGENWCPVAGAPGHAEWGMHPRKYWDFGLWLESPDGISAWPVDGQRWVLFSSPSRVHPSTWSPKVQLLRQRETADSRISGDRSRQCLLIFLIDAAAATFPMRSRSVHDS